MTVNDSAQDFGTPPKPPSSYLLSVDEVKKLDRDTKLKYQKMLDQQKVATDNFHRLIRENI